ncbi:MAG: pyridoxine 5'-phosphate synthase [Gluconacetobacter diazotrophicus]|nr:pyridoxine 5'-phosphate synthase [Gluconacetobacter diazotrophicus]
MSLTLGVNIDHVATLRQARYARTPEAHNVEPDLVAAAAVCERAGAQSITVHLRADRRHLQDRDLARLRESVRTKLNLEMGNTPEILAIALQTRPEDVCLVPENRQEITTEGGLDAEGLRAELAATVRQLGEANARVSLFIDPDEAQIRAAAELGAPVVELHTGAFANAVGDAQTAELRRLHDAAALAQSLGLQVNAGHGLNYANTPLLLGSVPHLRELNIGHSIVSRSIFVGLERAVGEMLKLMAAYRD